MTYQLNAEYFHEFKPEFSWLTLGLLIAILIIGYLLGKSETRITKKGDNVTLRYASSVTHAAFTILAFMLSLALIWHEHGLGIIQWFFNVSGNGAGELSVWFAAEFFTGLFCVCYAALAYGVFNKGIKMSIMIAKGNCDGELKITRHNNMVQDFKANWNPESAEKTVGKAVAKTQSIIPAMEGARVVTRKTV